MAKYNLKTPKIDTVSNNAWLSGVVTALDDGRVPLKGLLSANNMLLTEDGVITPRPGLARYLPEPTGTVLGRTFLFQSSAGDNWVINLQKDAQNEEQTVAITGTPTGGTFTLTYSGQTTSSIAYNASASDVQTALEALSNLDTGDVACTGGPFPGTGVVVEFTGTLANTDVTAMTSTSSLTGGTSPAITITETLKGGDHVYAYVAKPADTSWTKCNGSPIVTFSTSSYGRYFQIADKIMILTGEDTLAYFDVSTVDNDSPTVVQYDAIDDAAAPTISNSGSTDITTGTTPYTLYYAVTANSSVGQTTGTATSQAVTTQRTAWDNSSGFAYGLTVSWTAVTDAKSYNVYLAVTTDGTSNPELYLLAGNLSADNLSFVDNNSLGLSTIVTMPTANSTAGPICTYGTEINGQAWLWGDTTDKFMVRFGGTYGHELDFSGSNNSGFTHVGSGASEIPMSVINFRSGPGDPEIKTLSSDSVSDGKRYTLANQTITIGQESTFFWQVTEDYGKTGTPSPDAVIISGNSVYYPSRGGFATTGTKPQLQNLLDTETFTDSILPDLDSITWSAMDKAVGLTYEGRLYFCLPINSSTNNQVWVCDLQRGGAWMKPWSIAADDMFLVRDSVGRTHQVVLSGNNFYELSPTTKSNDDGTAFITSGETGLNYFSDDGEEWAHVIRFDITVLRPRKHANFTLYGWTDAEQFEAIGSGSFDEDVITNTGYGWGDAAWSSGGWSDINYVPDIKATPSITIPIEVEQDLLYWQLQWDSNGSGTDYSISKVTTVQVNIGIKN